MEGLVIGVVFVFILFLVGLKRSTPSAKAIKARDLVSFSTSLAQPEVFKAILSFAQTSGLNIESMEEAQGEIVLGENLSLLKNHNGYWLPIYLSSDVQGNTLVEMAIQSKAYQAGFMLRKIRDNALNNLKASIILQGGTMGTKTYQQTPPESAFVETSSQPAVKITMARKR